MTMYFKEIGNRSALGYMKQIGKPTSIHLNSLFFTCLKNKRIICDKNYS